MDDNQEVAAQCGIRAMPTFKFYRFDQQVAATWRSGLTQSTMQVRLALALALARPHSQVTASLTHSLTPPHSLSLATFDYHSPILEEGFE